MTIESLCACGIAMNNNELKEKINLSVVPVAWDGEMSRVDFREMIDVDSWSSLTPVEVWLGIEEWAGGALSGDFKEFVNLYGDGIVRGHLYVPHPCGAEPLIDFMKRGRESLRSVAHHYLGDSRYPRFDVDSVIPWGYSDWDGDQCYLVPRGKEAWDILVEFRQFGCVRLYQGCFSTFISGVLSGTAAPPGWPGSGPLWKALDRSPLV
ncbi:hypothetical protein [Kitasatospora sp. NPDC088351]|uniref:hypothetical protein n=1 Tax=Kitasatospora sp. NPDC088351 TaxID=3155180 RepID=UPI003431FA08